MSDLYKILEVTESATQADIKKSYRRLSKIYHPDVIGTGDENKFKEIQNAYDVLSDENKRSNYDNNKKFGNNIHGFQDFDFGGSMGADFFNRFFNRDQQQQRNVFKRGSDLRLHLSLSLEEIYSGVIKKIKFNRREQCHPCSGTGALDGKSFVNCMSCNGSGRKTRMTQSFFGGVTQVISTCDECYGEGKKIDKNCLKCKGEGIQSIDETIELQIPQGVQNGMQFTVSEKGDFIKGANIPGDLFIVIDELSHNDFIRINHDLHKDYFITIPQSILGDSETIVQTINGDIKIKIDPNTETGKTLRIQGKGMPIINSNNFGDLYIHINVYIPKDLSEEDKKYIEKLSKKSIFNIPNTHSQKGVFKRINEFKNLFQ